MTHDLVLITKKNGIAYVSLNRPEKYNALNYKLFKEIDLCIKTLAKDRALTAVVLFGEGGNFSSGLDVKSVMSSPLDAVKLLFKFLPGNANLAQRVSIGWRRLPVPVIAVLEGVCYGGGMQIVLGADFRIAAPDCKMSIMEAKWGLVPDMAGFAGLRELMPKDQALKLTMSAEVLSAQQALSINLVTAVEADPLAAATALATKLARTSPDANAAIKHSINKNWTAPVRHLLSRESWYQVRLLLGKNRVIAALRQTKKPDKPYRNRQSGW
ncbi:crotonase/enoyl-CoA hydratase family protein [Shewanella schlegeliana]|uniref:Crotonase/enoyl-CoA hydratase family protein n=1 Tax=Shewanella schlegeliana TaxID=190308 RepID=A0ABS1SWP5_9GAMM|nr:crotonase/enoyl-CoA hydratase family protein [Shewanella schlegeliana]MBL4912958.1 crotonase/enoyl-CoA hydratase family protein [Shewanella schlegeliana]MCL1108946.1 crotonase/enoyl-CoA hydratase family protein [Shewanella schlegeliana]GIU23591.1 enoyl-CoA hydratase [Shewanella schlegeliana]